MAWIPKVWVDRSVEFAGRRKLTAVPGQADTFDVARAEGTIFVVGDEPDAANLNAEFGNVKTELDAINTSLNAVSDVEVVDIKNSSNISIGKMVKLGKLRILSIFSGANNNNADGTITTISDVPVAQLYSNSAYGATNTTGSFRVDINGKIYLLSSAGAPIQSPYVVGNITFVVN